MASAQYTLKAVCIVDEHDKRLLPTAIKVVRVHAAESFRALFDRLIQTTEHGQAPVVLRVVLNQSRNIADGAAAEVQDPDDHVFDTLNIVRASEGYDPAVIRYVVREAELHGQSCSDPLPPDRNPAPAGLNTEDDEAPDVPEAVGVLVPPGAHSASLKSETSDDAAHALLAQVCEQTLVGTARDTDTSEFEESTSKADLLAIWPGAAAAVAPDPSRQTAAQPSMSRPPWSAEAAAAAATAAAHPATPKQPAALFVRVNRVMPIQPDTGTARPVCPPGAVDIDSNVEAPKTAAFVRAGASQPTAKTAVSRSRGEAPTDVVAVPVHAWPSRPAAPPEGNRPIPLARGEPARTHDIDALRVVRTVEAPLQPLTVTRTAYHAYATRTPGDPPGMHVGPGIASISVDSTAERAPISKRHVYGVGWPLCFGDSDVIEACTMRANALKLPGHARLHEALQLAPCVCMPLCFRAIVHIDPTWYSHRHTGDDLTVEQWLARFRDATKRIITGQVRRSPEASAALCLCTTHLQRCICWLI